jgi:outer membrane protein OmpA-like peptidoglycan-associated protein
MRRSIALAAALLPLSPVLSPRDVLAAPMLLGGVEAGETMVKPDDGRIPAKKGPSFGGYLGAALLPTDDSYLSLGLGAQSYALKGTKGSRSQELDVRAFLVDLDYGWRFGGFEAGLLARLNSGKAASLAAKDENRKSSAVYAGPEIGYRWGGADSAVVARFSAVRDLNVDAQANTSFVAGVQYWLSVGGAEPAPPAPQAVAPEPTPSPTEMPQEPAPPPQATPPSPQETAAPQPAATTLRFKADVFVFGKASDRLLPASQAKVQEIGAILARHAQSFTSIEVSGHADAGGKAEANQKLSERRAKAVSELLASKGVPAALLAAKGYGSAQPLPGHEPKDPANRRVELKIFGLTEGHEAIQQLQPYLVND